MISDEVPFFCSFFFQKKEPKKNFNRETAFRSRDFMKSRLMDEQVLSIAALPAGRTYFPQPENFYAKK